MLFNSLEYFVFFTAVTITYFTIAHRFRWMLLLAASYFFYGCWEPEYLILILFSTVTDFLIGLKMGRTEEQRSRNALLIFSLTVNLGFLFFFKYYDFFRSSLAELTGTEWQPGKTGWLLPVGISFYTFQTLAYTIDVYLKNQVPIRHFGRFALFVSFFPQLVAGPIERAGDLLPQFRKKVWFVHERVTNGLALMLWGLFKKVAVADRLALLVDEVYRQPEPASGLDLIAATIAFAFQIYCDFSGYSDMAVGAAMVLGISLMDNFNRPYSACSIREFWGRWHISLSTWFRDYLYRPLGGNRVSARRWAFNIFVVFLLSGLWHGANWTFVAWGALHGLYYLIERFVGAYWTPPRPLRRLLTFGAVCLAWVFFRARSMGEATFIVSRLFSDWSLGFPVIGALPGRFLGFTLLTWMLMLILEKAQGSGPPRGLFPFPDWARWGLYLLLIFCCILLGNYDSLAFIYFQF